MRRSTRRELVAATTATALTAAVPPAWGRLLSTRPGMGPGAFVDGVASGEPGPRAVTFWSRLRTDRPRSGARLIVARDEGLRDVVATAVVPTGRGVNHTLKARLGGLKPHTEYFYVWQSSTSVSPVGRTRTRPDPTSATPLRIAFSSCQHYSFGHFGAHANAAADDLDAYLFLGDYIYERGRVPVPGDPRVDTIDADDLASYRRKYRLYRSDPGLRELHRLHPALHVWDDHEVENNYSDNAPAPSPLQRAAGYRVAFEWLPRVTFARDRHRIYKSVPFGTMAEVFLLDERQYRTGSNDGQPRRILGDAQMSWLIGALKSSPAQWKLVANQVMMAANPFGDGPRLDMWDGYADDRARLLGEIERAGIRNVVLLTGDAHVFSCNLLASDFAALGDGAGRTPAAVEYAGGSVTSLGLDKPEAEVRSQSPWNKQYNGLDHGYAVLALDAAQLVTEYRRTDVTSPAGATTPFERFTQPAGVNNITRETLAPSASSGT
jgi:phosphodiesterase/alkaline phosphatase D-like protein